MADYKIGDEIFVASGRYGGTRSVEKWTVLRITPTGQIGCDKGRLSKFGNVIGDSQFYSRIVVTPERAAQIAEVSRKDDLWRSAYAMTRLVDVAVGKRDTDALKAAGDKLAQAIDILEKERG